MSVTAPLRYVNRMNILDTKKCGANSKNVVQIISERHYFTMRKIPASHMRLLTDPIVAHLATLLSDGRPQVNPVWCDYDGTYVRVNAAADRQKTRNMRRRGFATVFLADGPYFWMEIRGRVIHSTTEGAMDHMHSMAKKYTGRDTYTPIRTGEVRVMFTIEPERVVTFGTGAP
jgi:PPOX class probable F420-dependent enzyme